MTKNNWIEEIIEVHSFDDAVRFISWREGKGLPTVRLRLVFDVEHYAWELLLELIAAASEAGVKVAFDSEARVGLIDKCC